MLLDFTNQGADLFVSLERIRNEILLLAPNGFLRIAPRVSLCPISLVVTFCYVVGKSGSILNGFRLDVLRLNLEKSAYLRRVLDWLQDDNRDCDHSNQGDLAGKGISAFFGVARHVLT
jgi:hypothetical protein